MQSVGKLASAGMRVGGPSLPVLGIVATVARLARGAGVRHEVGCTQ
jgi:hypothetical protein